MNARTLLIELTDLFSKVTPVESSQFERGYRLARNVALEHIRKIAAREAQEAREATEGEAHDEQTI